MTYLSLLGKFGGSGSRPVLFLKNICADYFWAAGRLTANISGYPAVHINELNHYTQSNLLIDNVPLSAYINNYLI